MKQMKVIAVLVTLLIQMPVWYYLIYKILESINASELMWFLFWVYVPLGFFCSFVLRASESKA